MQTQSTIQVITPDLRQWIRAQAAAGCASDDILRSMLASGWQDEVARFALHETLHPQPAAEPQTHTQAQAEAQALPPGVPVPEPDLAGAPALLRLPDREVRVLIALRQPRVLYFGSFLSDAECDGLMDLARPRLSRSETVDNASGGSEVNAARTSDGMFFQRGEAPLIERIEARIAALLRWPVDKGEGLQILRYRPGAEYRPHYDYFDPAMPGTAAVLKRGGQRVGTLLMYLNEPAAGGATIFPDLDLEVAPVKGHALFFSYERAHESTRTLHGGAPVTSGEKWVATKWLREGVFE